MRLKPVDLWGRHVFGKCFNTVAIRCLIGYFCFNFYSKFFATGGGYSNRNSLGAVNCFSKDWVEEVSRGVTTMSLMNYYRIPRRLTFL